MAFMLYRIVDIPDFDLGQDVHVLRIAMGHEPVASTVSFGPNAGQSPCIGYWMEVQGTGTGADITFGSGGRLRVRALYTDTTNQQLTTDSAPFSTAGAISRTTKKWVQVYADGKVRPNPLSLIHI